MRIASDWKDFEVIDCSGGDKLERWGKMRLIRQTPRSSGIPPRAGSRKRPTPTTSAPPAEGEDGR